MIRVFQRAVRPHQNGQVVAVAGGTHDWWEEESSAMRRGCQLKDEPMQAWGMPSRGTAQALKPSTYYSGYIKRA